MKRVARVVGSLAGPIMLAVILSSSVFVVFAATHFSA